MKLFVAACVLVAFAAAEQNAGPHERVLEGKKAKSTKGDDDGVKTSKTTKSEKSTKSSKSSETQGEEQTDDDPMKSPKMIMGEEGDEMRISDTFMVTMKKEDSSGRRLKKMMMEDLESMVSSKCHECVMPIEGEKGQNDFTFKGEPKFVAECCNMLNEVEMCEEDHLVDLESIDTSLPFGLDRIDQEDKETDGEFFMRNPTYAGLYNGNMAYNASGVHVYILDSGLDGSHEQFKGRVEVGKDFFAKAITDENVENDNCDHGTHVAGTCCGETMGVAPGCKIHPVKAFGGSGCGGSYTRIRSALIWIKEHHMVHYNSEIGVVNLSFSGKKSRTINKLVNDLYTKANLIPVASAGNNRGKDACSKTPAGARRAVTVAASTTNDKLASFSNVGSCVNIIAPGVGIYSSIPGNEYAKDSGTSVSVPHVVGALALVIDEKHNSIRDWAKYENVGVNSIFQRVRNKAQQGIVKRVDPNANWNKLLNIEYHRYWLNNFVISSAPSTAPSHGPSVSSEPSSAPSDEPSVSSDEPSVSSEPSSAPSDEPSVSSDEPSVSSVPSSAPSDEPSVSSMPTSGPSDEPSVSSVPTSGPSDEPSVSSVPTSGPSDEPTP